MTRDWRTSVLVTTARFVPAVVAVPIALALYAHPPLAWRYLPYAGALLVAALWAGFHPRPSPGTRALILGLPLLALGHFAATKAGPSVSAGLILAMATLLVGFAKGGLAGLATLWLTAGALWDGFSRRPAGMAYLEAGLPLPESLPQVVLSYLVVAGLFLLLVTRAASERDRAEAEARSFERRRHAAQAAFLRLSLHDAVVGGDLGAAAAEITRAGTTIFEVERCALWLLRDDDSLERVAVFRHGSGLEEPDRGHPIAATDLLALEGERALAIDDAPGDPRTAALRGCLAARDVRSLIWAPIHAAGRRIGALSVEHVGPSRRRWEPDDAVQAASLADCAARALDAVERAAAQARLARAYGQLGQLTRRLEAAKEEERRHIARELHDDLGQSLTAVKLSLKVLAAMPAAPPARLAEGIEVVDRAILSVRALSRSIRPPLLDEVGLVPALQTFLAEQARLSGLPFDLKAGATPASREPTEIETAAFRIVQEAVTNTLRHAAAHRVTVEVSRTPRALEIAIRDDGRGIDLDEVAARAESGEHLGIVGMRERVAALGGTLSILPRRPTGTEVRAQLPVAS